MHSVEVAAQRDEEVVDAVGVAEPGIQAWAGSNLWPQDPPGTRAHPSTAESGITREGQPYPAINPILHATCPRNG